jgi:hypothetical protein
MKERVVKHTAGRRVPPMTAGQFPIRLRNRIDGAKRILPEKHGDC